MAFRFLLSVLLSTATFLIIYLQAYHHYKAVHKNDPFYCKALLHTGTWSYPSIKWEPQGCHIAEYPKRAINDCLRGRRTVFVGDSVTRQLFWAAARRLDAADVVSPAKHQDLSLNVDGVKVKFIWDPWLNSTALKATLRAIPPEPKSIYDERKGTLPTDLIVIGAPGLWAARYGGDDYLDLFAQGVSGIIPYLSSTMPKPESTIEIGTRIFLAPVQTPVYDKLSPNRSITITPDRIKAMNDYLLQLSPSQSLHVPWVFNRLSIDPKNSFDVDGLHVSDDMAALKLDIVLNAHCNAEKRARSRYFRGTCCAPNPDNKIFSAVLILGIFMAVYRACGLFGYVPQNLELSRANLAIIFTLIWCWVSDGTSFLGREDRRYQEKDFIKVCFYWLVVSIAGLWRTTPPRNQALDLPIGEVKREIPEYNGPGYLSREQSDEIKGLMQGFILLYHYHYASQTLWVYKIIRLFISGYFYLSGYGHTIYLLKTNDYSPRRFAAFLFRINFLTVLMSYMMGTTYSLYYFAPAITFWYFVIYLVLGFFKSQNHRLLWLITKVAVAAFMVDWFTAGPGPINAVTRLLRVVFRMSLDAKEMRFRLRLDRYVVFVGMIVAALVHKASTNRARAIFTIGRFQLRLPKEANAFINITCFSTLFTWFYFTQNHPQLGDKKMYNEFHSLVSWTPILAFVVFRNSRSIARQFHLAPPVALGRISLETYILQHHIWLGRDAKEWLTLGILEGR
ncbi:Cas1p-domain-containing protein [Hypomontagnella monticulosa]|nr:Cas1p-domain-containing protein [Hypomontagnella monticulosa]